MNKIVLFLISLLAVATAGAQTSHVATLSHDGEISTFYSSNALVSALAQASDGDIITLSSGSFTAPKDLTKNVTIRGAGMILEESPSILMGAINIKIPSSDTNKSLVMEGLYFNSSVVFYQAYAPQFIKCWFNEGTNHLGAEKVSNYLFLHCVFDSRMKLDNYCSGSATNCLIKNAKLSNCEVKNSTVIRNVSSNLYFYSSSLTNCVIKDEMTTGSSLLESNNVAVNCTYIGKNSKYFQSQASDTNIVFPAETPVFKEGTFYELLDELQTTWLGNDGTQRGMYGSSWPFDPTTTNPRITKFNVAKKTTADGKLPVEIEVEAN